MQGDSMAVSMKEANVKYLMIPIRLLVLAQVRPLVTLVCCFNARYTMKM